MTTRVEGLTGATLERAPQVCHACVWWQSSGRRRSVKPEWIRDTEAAWGAWGAIYRDDDGRTLGSIQYGPATAFPRVRGSSRRARRRRIRC